MQPDKCGDNREEIVRSYQINGQCGREVITYKGTFEPVAGQHDIVTALAAEFANGDINDLIEWMGGDAELADIAAAGDFYELANDDSVFQIWVSDESATPASN